MVRRPESNSGPPKKLVDQIAPRVNYRKLNSVPDGIGVPADAVTASASGLDPHQSRQCTASGKPSRANSGNLQKDRVLQYIDDAIDARTFGI